MKVQDSGAIFTVDTGLGSTEFYSPTSFVSNTNYSIGAQIPCQWLRTSAKPARIRVHPLLWPRVGKRKFLELKPVSMAANFARKAMRHRKLTVVALITTVATSTILATSLDKVVTNFYGFFATNMFLSMAAAGLVGSFGDHYVKFGASKKHLQRMELDPKQIEELKLAFGDKVN